MGAIVCVVFLFSMQHSAYTKYGMLWPTKVSMRPCVLLLASYFIVTTTALFRYYVNSASRIRELGQNGSTYIELATLGYLLLINSFNFQKAPFCFTNK